MKEFKRLPYRNKDRISKYVLMYNINPDVSEDVVPLSIADMEFEMAPAIRDGLKDYLDQIVLGYSRAYPDFIDAVINWHERKHGYKIEEDWLLHTPGVVNAFTAALRAFANPGDGVIIFRPIYHPMQSAIKDSNLEEINIPLINNKEEYTIDYEAYEKAAQDPNNKVLLFCSPHNPVGRVWRKEELEKISKIALENDLIIISDEIWQDLVLEDNKHTVLASISPEVEDITITCTAPSKTFNIAGLYTSNIIVSNPVLREKLAHQLDLMGSRTINILGYKGCELAYTKCDDWLEGLLEVLSTNKEVAQSYCDKWGLNYSDMEGTYVLWVDFGSLGMSDDELEEFMYQDAEFFANQGYIFGEEGSGYQRINLALPTEALKVQLDRLDKALANL